MSEKISDRYPELIDRIEHFLYALDAEKRLVWIASETQLAEHHTEPDGIPPSRRKFSKWYYPYSRDWDAMMLRE